MLGDVLKIVEIIITDMKWITHHHSGWQPITITVPAETRDDTNSNSGVNIDRI